MEITVIHGQMHKGSTYYATQEIMHELCEEKTLVHEFFLPKDGPDFCVGCFTCILKGESSCPHHEKIQQIANAIKCSGIIVVDSPTYAFEMTGQLKTLFDHLCYMWLSHRPNKAMFHKTSIVVTTAAGAGMKRAAKSISNQMFWLGIPKCFMLPIAVNAVSWDEVSPKTKEKIHKKAKKITDQTRKHYGVGIKLRFMFEIMRALQRDNSWNETDKNYWQQKGWLGKERPWKLK